MEIISSSFIDCCEAAEERPAEAQDERRALHAVFQRAAIIMPLRLRLSLRLRT